MYHFIKTKPLFLFLLPVFFILHGFAEYYNLIPLPDALFLVLLYTAIAVCIAGLSWLFYRNFTKACLVAFFIMSFHFFFGSIQDLLQEYFYNSFITRYSFILPVSFFFFLLFIILLKNRKKIFPGFIYYLNLLLILLLAWDFAWLAGKIAGENKSHSINNTPEIFSGCDTCKKPDIYFIVLDEYAGNGTLAEQFNFDNSPFENELRLRGFHIIPGSTSNYNGTRSSIASTLYMDYLDAELQANEKEKYKYYSRVMRNSRVLEYFTSLGYRFYNYSYFDIADQPGQNYDNFLPSKTKLITSQTFLSRIFKDINYSIGSGKIRFRPLLKKYMYDRLYNNENFIRLTRELNTTSTSFPKFVYTHFMMPHYPYYYDSGGKLKPLEMLVATAPSDKSSYLGYLQFCNRKILQLVDHLRSGPGEKPVILLLGDHGFRHFEKKVDSMYYFMNLNAVYFPDKNYLPFYDSMSNVNLFRVVFNTQFHQHFPLLKDSTIFLK